VKREESVISEVSESINFPSGLEFFASEAKVQDKGGWNDRSKI
jgi:hypothetical protein